MYRVTRFLMGVLLGGVVGALLAILLAPSSGDDLRQNVNGYVNRNLAEIRGAALARRAELELELKNLRQPLPPAPPKA